MKCFHFYSFPDRKSDPKHRFSWRFFSQGSSSSQGKSTRSAPSSHLETSQPSSAETSFAKPDLLLHNPSVSRPPERAFSYAELRAVTKNFSRFNLLGEGGFGCVYKGVLKSQIPNEPDTVVAVKQLNKKGQQGHKEWLAEVRFLSFVEHPNLVKLMGYCAEDNERGIQRLLVYEYMENGSLEDHIFRRGRPVLPWKQRLLILLGAAEGLAYLHEGIDGIQVIFRDFKTSNVLLDKYFIPKLSDFGMAREGPEIGKTHVSTAVVGTLGYAAPEYIQTGHLTSKSDVWSFGVVLLEMLSGRRSLDRNLPKNEQQLLDWAKPFIHGNKKVDAIMDPHLDGQYSLIQAQKLAALAIRCLEKHARMRPLMSSVVKSLKEIVELNATDLQSDAPNESEIVNPVELKDSAATKRQRLIVKNVMHLKNREDAKNMWRVWTPKAIET